MNTFFRVPQMSKEVLQLNDPNVFSAKNSWQHNTIFNHHNLRRFLSLIPAIFATKKSFIMYKWLLLLLLDLSGFGGNEKSSLCTCVTILDYTPSNWVGG